MQDDQQHTQIHKDPRHTFVVESFSPAVFTTLFILNHSSEALPAGGRHLIPVGPETIRINRAVFAGTVAADAFPAVEVVLEEGRLLLHCDCAVKSSKLCEHQALVLSLLKDWQDIRVFFDAELRQRVLREAAKEYGLEEEKELEAHFLLEWTPQGLEIRPRRKELFPISALSGNRIAEQLLPKPAAVLPLLPEGSSGTKMIVVMGQHRFYNHLNLELYLAPVTREGKPKNPLTPLAPLDLIWKTDKQQELKFYSAIQKFQHNFNGDKSASDIAGLKALVKNPLGLDFYYHDARLSHNITALSLVPVQLKSLSPELRLYVHQKEDFYEVSGELVVADKAHALNSLKMRYQYFVLVGSTLYLIDRLEFLTVIDFFKQYNYTLLIHRSKFEEFKAGVLARLEPRVRIHYTYYKKATRQQLQEIGFARGPGSTGRNQPGVESPGEETPGVEQLIYLSDSEAWVLITPVMRYGEVEIPILSKKQLYATDAKGNPFAMERDEAAELEFLSRLLQQHPDFEGQLYEQGSYLYFDSFYLHRERFLDENWFLDAFEAWQQQGIKVLGFNQLSKNKLNPNKAKVSVHVNSGVDWFDTHLEVNFGGQKATLKHLQKALRNRSRFVQLDDGTQGLLPAEWIERLSKFFEAGEVVDDLLRTPKSGFRTISELYEEEMLTGEVKNEIAQIEEKLKSFEQIASVAPPAGLNASLRTYQKQGLNWLNFLDEWGFGGILADDMGLGKTLQMLAFLLHQREKGNTSANLVVVPTTLIFNWQAEVSKFAPCLRVLTLWGPGRVKAVEEFEDYELVLTSYGTLLQDVRFLKKYRFNYVVLDESQAIKNPETQRYKAARLLQARNRLVMTGTPLENNTFDLYAQLSFVNPGLLGSKQHFKEQFSARIDKFKDSRKARELQQKISPFILRRTKEGVAPELPEKTEMLILCEMGPEQRRVYNAYAKEFRDFLLQKSEGDIDRNSLHVLQGLTKLRQICNSPLLLNDAQFYSSASAKIEVLLEQIESKAPHHKILVFSQFVAMLELIKKELEARNIPYEYLTGQTRNRQGKVEAFQNNSSVRVFLISLKAGGTGLNLTEADYVYLVDPWWNPAVEAQAIDRTHRIGQQKKVVAIRLVTPDTIEEKMMRLQEDKAALAGDLVKADAGGLKSLTREELLGLLG
ncbi:DEAD/DEAH box helicase [Cesiribacter sp. SM1]|uniref:DEAD/DEAH box helicase n=1 Tax=Cesiribacter sp. SM1 TaxID=2861196 RepID=UPI001CD4592C|nr:DEAD/DEAH box helicase [Cesiribacter sp. SM1]